MTVHAVFSIDDSPYQRWQAELLAYSHRKVAQPGPLTCLLSGEAEPRPVLERIFHTRSWSFHPETGDHYPPFNRIAALIDWLRWAPPEEETVLLLDPDNVFLVPLDISVERGRPVAQPWSFPDPADNGELVAQHCLGPLFAQGVGIPLVIHRDDLAAVASGWLEKTEAIRNDPRSRELAGWLAEMWGYALAAAELGLTHELRETAMAPTEDRADLPIVHYFCGSESPDKSWQWNKWDYQAWERVEDPPLGVPAASVALVRLLNELVDIKATELLSRLRARLPHRARGQAMSVMSGPPGHGRLTGSPPPGVSAAAAANASCLDRLRDGGAVAERVSVVDAAPRFGRRWA